MCRFLCQNKQDKKDRTSTSISSFISVLDGGNYRALYGIVEVKSRSRVVSPRGFGHHIEWSPLVVDWTIV